ITINIDVVGTKDYWTKMQTAVSAGSGPDVFWMNGPNFALYASNGTLAPLDSSLVDTSNYPKALVDLYSLDGKL
uniref:extracellular solute-binding protein n=1 Tax=Sedimentibacter sp. B4 TaxID=304766 RepID=UPI0012F97FA9